jgi:hypothetical protein
LGRWLSNDPIDFSVGDVNTFRYLGNGPGNGLDAMGMDPQEKHVPPFSGPPPIGQNNPSIDIEITNPDFPWWLKLKNTKYGFGWQYGDDLYLGDPENPGFWNLKSGIIGDIKNGDPCYYFGGGLYSRYGSFNVGANGNGLHIPSIDIDLARQFNSSNGYFGLKLTTDPNDGNMRNHFPGGFYSELQFYLEFRR